MKKTRLLCLLLATVSLFASCSKVSEENKIPVYDYTLPAITEEKTPTQSIPSVEDEEAKQPSDPAALIGKWHSAFAASVFQFFTDHTVKMFTLAPGYFAYTAVESGTYTYDGYTLSCIFSSNNLTFPCKVAGNEMSITASNQTFAFNAVRELPTEHPTYQFPDFEVLALANPLTAGAYTGNTIATTLRQETISELEKNYWSTVSTDKLVALNEGTAKLGDLVNIDYTGKLNGVAFEGGTAQNQVVEVNQGTGFIDGFCEGIAGHSVGETFDVTVTFPENYGSTDLAGKEVVFTMKLNCIYDLTLTDEIAKKKGFDTLDAWVDSVYGEKLRDEVWNLIPVLKNASVPEDAYLFFYQYNLDILHAQALYYFNNQFEACLAYYGMTEESLLTDSQQTGRVLYQAAQLADLYDLTPDDELTAKIKEEYIKLYMADGYTQQQAEALLEGDGKAEFQARLMQELITDYLIENNTFTDSEA
ncbi:MAG: FKBP-type peptidyl-prolyl cis-trans isomerase [Clostridia bacterium]|nr:FKBP-type peptidyl-prolyl cis-trans isomerase [Clostridia bacterium]